MLRTVGSTLLAKASPGGALRKTEEQNIESPAIPGKGGIGTISRAGLEQPIERQVPPGSAKVVSSAPSVEGNVAPGGMLPTQPIPDTGMGLPGSTNPIAPSTPTRGVASAPNVGLLPQTLRSQASGTAAKTVSGGALAGAGVNTKVAQEMGEQARIQGNPSISGPDYVNPFVSGIMGTKVRADEGGQGYRPTTLQQVAGSVGSAMQKAGDAAKSGLAGPIGQALRSIVGSTGTAGSLQRFGGDPNVSKSGTGSVQKAAQSAASAIKSYNPVQTFKSNVNKTTSFLRSLFK